MFVRLRQRASGHNDDRMTDKILKQSVHEKQHDRNSDGESKSRKADSTNVGVVRLMAYRIVTQLGHDTSERDCFPRRP